MKIHFSLNSASPPQHFIQCVWYLVHVLCPEAILLMQVTSLYVLSQNVAKTSAELQIPEFSVYIEVKPPSPLPEDVMGPYFRRKNVQ